MAVSERIPLCSSRGVPARVQDLHPGGAAGQAQNRHREPGQGEQGVWVCAGAGVQPEQRPAPLPSWRSRLHPQCFWAWQRVISGHALQVPWELSALPCAWSSCAWRTQRMQEPTLCPPAALAPLRVLASCWPPRLRPLPVLHVQPPLAGSGLCLLGSAQTLWGKNERFWCPLLPSGWVLGAGGSATRSLCHFCGSPGSGSHEPAGAVFIWWGPLAPRWRCRSSEPPAGCRSETDGRTDGRPTERPPLAPRSTWSCCGPTRTGRPSA